MSFSSDAKNDICKNINAAKKCCELSLLYGILLSANTYTGDKIILKSENAEFVNIASDLISKYASPALSASGNLYTLTISGSEVAKISQIFKGGVIRCAKCRVKFITGCFLSCGTLSSPEKNYYVELKMGTPAIKDEILSILRAEGFDFKIMQRRGKEYLYLKESEQIEDFLYYIGAKTASYKVMDAKIVKELRNNINRATNFENANMQKLSSAAAYQMKMIDRLINEGRFSELDEDLQETAMLRRENIGSSLEEIAAMSSKPISKTGIFRRLKKIVAAAEE